MNALMIYVEQVVRPIRGEESQKLRMRKELLTHMLAAYEAELTEQTSEPLALERTLRRMGDPAALRCELQATVPRVSRWTGAIDQLVRRREGMSRVVHAARLAGVLGGFLALVVAGTLMRQLDEIARWTAKGSITFWFGLSVAMLFALNLFAFTLLAGALREVIDRRFARRFDLARVTGLNALAALGILATGWLLTFCVSGDAAAASGNLWRWGALAAIAVIMLSGATWADVAQRRDLDEWLQIDLGEAA